MAATRVFTRCTGLATASRIKNRLLEHDPELADPLHRGLAGREIRILQIQQFGHRQPRLPWRARPVHLVNTRVKAMLYRSMGRKKWLRLRKSA